jgi:hypothetical protein
MKVKIIGVTAIVSPRRSGIPKSTKEERDMQVSQLATNNYDDAGTMCCYSYQTFETSSHARF